MHEPKLRFKADDGSQFPDWNEKTFNDVADYKKGPFGSALKKEIFVPKSNDTVKVYEQQNAISKDWKLERYFVTNEYFQSKMKSFAVSGGDIIVSCAGTIGEMYELPHDAEEGIINQALMRVRIKKSVINSMIFRCVFDKMISTEGVKISNGSALKNIPPFADMKKQSVFVPSLPEQQKIAEFLSTIDTVIEKQKETVSAWEERKKGVMQKLFSQEVRFKADDGSDFPEWEEKKLGDIADFFNGDRSARYPKETDFVKYGVAFLNTENLHNTIVDISEKCKYITYEKYCELSGAKIQLLDIIYCLRGSVGLCSLNTILEEGTVASSLMVIRAVDSIIDPIYLYNSLNSDFVLGQLYQCLNGSCAGNLSAKDVTMFKIKCPCLAEQQKIADCLSSLDDVIEKQKATLTAWEELKKGLLQQMFV